ncbi:perlucin-like [Physella acuta]|uniref:perlucin-like n=1 Tax=Physella acuta TaxID=109671 RepID=UPI0027DDB1A7|nr:perlucin-like [Physella acuta]
MLFTNLVIFLLVSSIVATENSGCQWVHSVKIGRNCYTFFNMKYNFAEAWGLCKSLYLSGSLPVHLNYISLARLSSYMHGINRNTTSWVGLIRQGLTTWTWTDNTTASVSDLWDDNQPDNWNRSENCAHLRHNWKLNDVSCLQEMSFFCQEPQMPRSYRPV